MRRRRAISGVSRVVADYFGFVLKNVIGWVFILGSLTIGMTLPVPGGVPLMFLIGFTLITFPGKRRILSRVMRGTQMSVEPGPFGVVVIAVSVMVTMTSLWVASSRYKKLLLSLHLQLFDVLGVCLLAAGRLVVRPAVGIGWIESRAAAGSKTPTLSAALAEASRNQSTAPSTAK